MSKRSVPVRHPNAHPMCGTEKPREIPGFPPKCAIHGNRLRPGPDIYYCPECQQQKRLEKNK